MKVTEQRWALKKYFGLTEAEIILNEKLWKKLRKQEKMKKLKQPYLMVKQLK